MCPPIVEVMAGLLLFGYRHEVEPERLLQHLHGDSLAFRQPGMGVAVLALVRLHPGHELLDVGGRYGRIDQQHLWRHADQRHRARSLVVSKLSLANRLGLTTSVLLITRMVWPSAGAFAASAVPISPLLLHGSPRNRRPSRSETFGASMRAHRYRPDRPVRTARSPSPVDRDSPMVAPACAGDEKRGKP